MVTGAQFDQFLRRYRAFVSDRQGQKVAAFKARFDKMLSGYKVLKANIEEQELTEASRYNIFQILKVQHLEAKTHSPFLANLLDPKGSHGQKELFLRLFIEEFITPLKKEFDLQPDVYKQCHVDREHHTGGGFIDIWIRSFDRQKPFQIVIENKIFADDQDRQIDRYWRYLENFPNSMESKTIVYLSLYDRPPRPKSISRDDLDKLIGYGCFTAINYRDDLTRWLVKCLESCRSETVKQTINQYLKTIKNLSNEQFGQ